MSDYADTSFLISLYIGDSLSSSAADIIGPGPVGLPLSPFGRLEVRNALALGQFRRVLSKAQFEAAQRAIDDDLATCRLVEVAWPAAAFELAHRLVSLHSARFGTRSLDVLHVASALALGADTLLTFDRRQAALARAAGLRVRPA